MGTRPALVAMVILLLVTAVPAGAQMPTPAHFETWRPLASFALPDRAVTDSGLAAPNGSGMILGGITGWVVGWALGAAVGNAIGCGGDSSGECDFGPGLVGALVAGSFSIPLGVHMGNHGRGDLLKDALVSVAIGGLGIAVGSSVDETGLWLLLVPVGQIVGSVWMEANHTTRSSSPDASR